MTVRDPEILELLRDEPELLAVADAVAETQRLPRPRRWRRRETRLFAAAAVAVGVVAAVLLAPGGGGKHGIVDRALAAIGNGRVLHLVTRSQTGTVLVDLKTGRRIVQTFETESWSDQKSQRVHIVIRQGGAILGEIVLPDDANKRGVEVGTIDPAFAALWSGYRKALATGRAKLERKATLDGQPVYWLRFATYERGMPGTEVAIDRRTYKPVLFRSHVSKLRHFDQRVLVAETTAFRPAEFERRTPRSLLAGRSSSGFSELGPTPQRRARLRSPWLTAGRQVAGLRLAAVLPLTVGMKQRTINGIELVYGATFRGFAPPTSRRSLTVQELRRPDDAGVWKRIPRGFVSVSKGETGNGRSSYLIWTGYVVKHGIFVTIETARGERALIAAARALRPAP